MAFVLNDDGLTSLTIRYVERKKDGSFQYRRRIPQAVRHKYAGRLFLVQSLKRDALDVCQLAYDLTNKLNLQWAEWQNAPEATPLSSPSLVGKPKIQTKQDNGVASVNCRTDSICLRQAANLYLSHHVNGTKSAFKEDCDRVVDSAIALLGDRSIDAYSRSDAENIRDHWLKRGATRTTRRRLITLVAIVNKARKEKQLQMLNPFEGLGIIGEGEDGAKRIPFTSAELRVVSRACRNLNDDIRHIVAFLIDTGCRVSEVVGLRIEDVILDGPTPYVRIRPFGKVRTLKTPASERDIPLVGDALWAAERALEARRRAKGASLWLFPRYASDKEIKATHASATLNKWLRSLEGLSEQKTCHCARHAMRDRLRAAQVPVEIQDVIGGWGSRTIGQGYGNGYPLQVLANYMLKISVI